MSDTSILSGRETQVSDTSILRWKGDTGIRYEHLKVEGRHTHSVKGDTDMKTQAS